ncbi:hypothetical protein [Rhodopseudomonas palustris]|uniref:Uncharacterized protein n=1 Tax=Rhodopseudomonas palustris (strain BisB18) TaxID=316056 RepID=Q21CQ4_RHOPB
MSLANLLTGGTRFDKPTHPLTHHEILGLMAPFTRRQRHLDLAASDRSNRRLVFKPITHSGDDEAVLTEACETLLLENPRIGSFRLTRTVTLASGLKATLTTEGADPGDLLARIETVPPQRQFRCGDEGVIAQSYRLVPADSAWSRGEPDVRMELTRGEAEFEGLTLILHAPTVKGYPADIDLVPKSPGCELPEDLLAVIGWAWGPLRKTQLGWNGKLKVRGSEPHLSEKVEARLQRTVAHLSKTLAHPPCVFHDTLRRARWGVTLRRALPLLFFAALIAGAAGLTFVEIPKDSMVNLLIMGAPPLLLFAAFGMRDTPPLEIPPLPRRSKAAAWLPSHPAPATAATNAPATLPAPPTAPTAPTAAMPSPKPKPTEPEVLLDAQ